MQAAEGGSAASFAPGWDARDRLTLRFLDLCQPTEVYELQALHEGGDMLRP